MTSGSRSAPVGHLIVSPSSSTFDTPEGGGVPKWAEDRTIEQRLDIDVTHLAVSEDDACDVRLQRYRRVEVRRRMVTEVHADQNSKALIVGTRSIVSGPPVVASRQAPERRWTPGGTPLGSF